MTEQDTAELVQRAATGDELAWRRLTDEFGPLLRHVSWTYRLGEAEAADAVATTWFRLVEHIASLRDGCAVQGGSSQRCAGSASPEPVRAVASGPWQISRTSTSRSTSWTSTAGW